MALRWDDLWLLAAAVILGGAIGYLYGLLHG